VSCIVVLLVVLWAPSASAFDGFDDGGGEGLPACAVCHADLADHGPDHDAHAGLSNSDCDSCHANGSGFNNPPLANCVRCHGRDDDAGGDGGFSAGLGRGLRQHHVTAGSAACGNCHGDATGPAGVGEDVLPSFYPLALGGAGLDSCDGSEETFASNTVSLDNDGDGLTDGADQDCTTPAPLDEFPQLVSMANFNGDNDTDLGVVMFDPDRSRNSLTVIDGSSGNEITTVGYGIEPARGSSTVPDATGDQVPEFSVLVEGSLFARVRDVVNNTLLGRPSFNANYDPVAFFSVGDAGGSAGPDVVMVGRLPSTGRVLAWVREAQGGAPVSQMAFSKAFVPFAAVAVDNVGDSAAMEIAVLGINASGKVQATVKDAASGNFVGKVVFAKAFAPLFFAAVPDANGDLTQLAVLGRKANGIIQAQIRRVSDGALVANVRFSKNYDPMAFISFADSNGSGGGEVGVVGVNASGTVRAEVKEIADGTTVNLSKFSRNYPPLDAIAINGVAGTGRNEIAVLGENTSNQLRLEIRDLLTGDLVNSILLP
jgi:hypothetical protein